jgi:soluble cytochrome b562
LSTKANVDVDELNKMAKRLVEAFHQFTKHSPKLLRDSMMMSYCKAIDDLMQAMDHCKLEKPIEMTIEKPIVLVDSSGHAL